MDNLDQNQVEQLGQDPSLIEAVTMLLKQLDRAEQEARQARIKQEKELIEVTKNVKENHENHNVLTSRMIYSEKLIADIQRAQKKAESRLAQVEFSRPNLIT